MVLNLVKFRDDIENILELTHLIGEVPSVKKEDILPLLSRMVSPTNIPNLFFYVELKTLAVDCETCTSNVQ